MTPDAKLSNRVAAAVDASDLNNARTLAVLSTPPFSRVLDIGSGAGLASRALSERGCRIWAIEKDPEAAAEAERWCEHVLTADVETIDLERALGRERFDMVLLLDVVEHLREPARTLSALARILAPGGRVILSVPNVGHAAVRLQLLTGRFIRTDSGLLDRTHLQFFDRASLYALLASADLRVVDEMRTVRAATETEIPVNLEALPADAVRLATHDADALTYQYVVVAVPGDGHTTGVVQGIGGALQEKIVAVEKEYHALEKWARDLEVQLQKHSGNDVHAAAAKLEAGVARYEELAGGLLRLQRELADAVRALERSRTEVRCLQQDLEVKEAYLATLRDRDARRQSEEQELRRLLSEAQAEIVARDDNVRAVRERLTHLEAQAATEVPARDKSVRALEQRLARSEAQAATEILALDETVRILQERLSRLDAQALASARAAAELRDEVRGYQTTLSLPRYRVADAMNRAFRLMGPIHRLVKGLVKRRVNGA